MQVKLFNNPVPFKGSFKIQDLESFIQDFEEDEVQKPQQIKNKEISKIIKPSGLIAKNSGIIEKNGTITAVVMCPAIQGQLKNNILPTFSNICAQNNVNPDSDLFMVSGLDPLKRRYIMFNSFYKDEKTGINCVQLFYTSSEDSNLTQTQKDIIKIFNDKRNRYYLCEGSTKNPFAKASNNGIMLGGVFKPVITGLESISNNFSEEDMINSKNEVNPVIYSQTPNGIYTRYKVITLYR